MGEDADGEFSGENRLLVNKEDPTMRYSDIITPAFIVDRAAFEHNLQAMASFLPGARLRPHVKAHKSTAIAKHQARLGHTHFTCAMVGQTANLQK